MTNEDPTSLSEDPTPSNGPINGDKSDTWRYWPGLLSLISTIWRKLPLWRSLALSALPVLVGCLVYDKVYDNKDSMIVRVDGNFPITTLIKVEGPNGERLYTQLGRHNIGLREISGLRMRITEKNLVRGCITFVEFDTRTEKDPVYFNTNFFLKRKGGFSNGEQEDFTLNYTYSHLHSSFKLNGEEVSSPECPSSNQSSEGFLDFLIPNAWADETTSTFKELVNALTFDDAPLRREARQLLVAKGIAAVEPVMAALRKEPESYRLQIGAIVMLSEMLEGTVEAKEIRTKLTEEDIRLLANLVINADDVMIQRLTETMTGLADPRAIDAFFRIINDPPNEVAYRNAREVLLSMVDELYELLIQKQEIADRLQKIANSQEESIRERIDQRLQSVKKPQTEGWVYVGIFFGENWDEKHFNWDGDSKGPPQKDDILTLTATTESVNLRVDHIRFEEGKGWVNSRVIGVIQPKDTVKVLEIQTVAEGYHWVKVEKINGKRKP